MVVGIVKTIKEKDGNYEVTFSDVLSQTMEEFEDNNVTFIVKGLTDVDLDEIAAIVYDGTPDVIINPEDNPVIIANRWLTKEFMERKVKYTATVKFLKKYMHIPGYNGSVDMGRGIWKIKIKGIRNERKDKNGRNIMYTRKDPSEFLMKGVKIIFYVNMDLEEVIRQNPSEKFTPFQHSRVLTRYFNADDIIFIRSKDDVIAHKEAVTPDYVKEQQKHMAEVEAIKKQKRAEEKARLEKLKEDDFEEFCKQWKEKRIKEENKIEKKRRKHMHRNSTRHKRTPEEIEAKVDAEIAKIRKEHDEVNID